MTFNRVLRLAVVRSTSELIPFLYNTSDHGGSGYRPTYPPIRLINSEQLLQGRSD